MNPILKDLLLIILPTGGVIFTVYFILNKYFKTQKELYILEFKKETNGVNKNESTPLKIQAYERLMLFLKD